MKRSEFITQVLNNSSNTVFVTKDQVAVALDIFEKLGMLPPETKSTPEDWTHIDMTQEFLNEHDFKVNRWEKE